MWNERGYECYRGRDSGELLHLDALGQCWDMTEIGAIPADFAQHFERCTGIAYTDEFTRRLVTRRVRAGIAVPPHRCLACDEHGSEQQRSRGARHGVGRRCRTPRSLRDVAAEDGQPLEWLHPQDAIAPNQTHGVVVAPALLGIEVFRLQRNYEVAITKHTTKAVNGKPKLQEQFESNRPTLIAVIRAPPIFCGVRPTFTFASKAVWRKT